MTKYFPPTTLSNSLQPSFPSYIASALHYIEILGFLSSPENPDPLQLRNFHFDTRNILDEYYRLVLASPTIGPVPIPMYIATDFAVRPKTLVEVSRISNIPTPHILNLKSFLQQYSFLCRTTCILGTRKLVLAYSSPCELRNFFFDPGRSRHLYPVSWIIGKCWEAIEYMSQTRPLANTHSNPPEVGSLVYGLSHFFKGSERNGHFSGASHMLSAVRTEAEDEYLLRFLVFLCRIPWLNFCLELDGSAAIAQWALVS
ncbi:hypothetical protein M413DRAFT_378997 [Hebeloma cylindrosporum]|uniref:Uncharacterized protein n=1 Tax=Hebeloma cylindrosporum TaxID=76867 RepID=A0A0C3C612_HEBCY|nr:hypothetical protein M413DRAFT_378997 [Hebeloma cylindrosporum h7]